MNTTTKNRLATTITDLRRHSELLRLLTADLTEMLEEPSDDETMKWAVEVLGAMLDNFRKQCQLEEENEYLADVLEHYPSWYPQVEGLRQQHAHLHRQLQGIRERIVAHAGDGAVLSEAYRHLVDWINSYNEHQHVEAKLIQDAFTLEIGAGE